MSPQHRAERASEIFQERTALSRSRVVERERKKALFQSSLEGSGGSMGPSIHRACCPVPSTCLYMKHEAFLTGAFPLT